MRGRGPFTLAIIAFAFLLFILLVSENGDSRTIVVDNNNGSWSDFAHIQDAIDDASPHDVIRVFAGDYEETATVPVSLHNLSVIGNGTSTRNLASEPDYVYEIYADNCTFSDMKIYGEGQENNKGFYVYETKDCIIANLTIYWVARGIRMHECEWTVIQESNLSRCSDWYYNDGMGMYITDSSNITIKGNYIAAEMHGIEISGCENISAINNTIKHTDDDPALYVRYSDHCNISSNSIQGNDAGGIKLDNSNNNTLGWNNIDPRGRDQSGKNLKLVDCYDNLIQYNHLLNNVDYSISLEGSRYNLIYLNNISDCDLSPQAYDDSGRNYWDDGSRGNYWSDYNGTDGNGDGIGDTEYIIDGHNSSEDRYPLMDSPIPDASNRTVWIVDDDNGSWADFENIQDAVDEAQDGDIIRVFEGEYKEHITILTSVRVRGNGTAHTIVNGTNNGTPFEVDTDNVTISDLTVTGGVHESIGTDYGIMLTPDSIDCIISDCRFVYNDRGIHSNGHSNTIQRCVIENNSYGIVISTEEGCIISCEISSNEKDGIRITSGPVYVQNCSIFDNGYSGIYGNGNDGAGRINNCTIHDNEDRGIIFYLFGNFTIDQNNIYANGMSGLYIYGDSAPCTIYNNTFKENGNFGLVLGTEAEDHWFYHNDFIDNDIEPQVKVEEDNNSFTKDGKGNYYSDYTGSDDDYDGIGDTPYEFNGSEGEEDIHPLMRTYGSGAKTWIVDDDNGSWADFENIQDALNASIDGDMIRIFNGSYNENIIVNMSIDMIGNGSKNTILNGSNIGKTVLVDTDNVTISDLSITGGDDDVGIEAGIHLSANAIDCLISNCLFYDNDRAIVSHGRSNTIQQCVMTNNTYGIVISTEDGLVDSCRISNSFFDGIRITSGPMHIENCTVFDSQESGILGNGGESSGSIRNSSIYENGHHGVQMFHFSEFIMEFNEIFENDLNGLYIYGDSFYHIVRNNTFRKNGRYGLGLGNDAKNNSFYHNNFIDNGWSPQVLVDEDYNSFHKDMKGNYYSDYSGSDYDYDGIGDTPYEFNGSEGEEDIYPLMRTYGSDARTWIVDDDNGSWADFDNIQDAVDAVVHGDLIRILNGTYEEEVHINISVAITGNGTDTVLSGRNDFIPIRINAENVTISGLNITECSNYHNFSGIRVLRSANATIMKCMFYDLNSQGIVFINSSNGYVRDSTFESCINGTSILGSDGVIIKDTEYLNSTLYGIVLFDSDSAKLRDNRISWNHIGLLVQGGSSGANIWSNNFTGNDDHAVRISSGGPGIPSGNVFYNNYFCGNDTDEFAVDDGDENFWNHSNGHGNYWDDYNGTDNDRDGIGDTAYDISGTADAVDNYPIVPITTTYRTWIVDDDNGRWADHNSIEDALGDAEDGDVIRVYSGDYSETFDIEVKVDLIGNGSEDTIIRSDANDQLIDVREDHVNITGFFLTNDHSDKHVIRLTIGNATVFDNYINGSGNIQCISLKSDHNNIYNNTCEGAKFGIKVPDGHHNRIHGNVLRYNLQAGLYLEDGNSNKIYSNTIYRNNGMSSTNPGYEVGIGLYSSDFNLITYNNISRHPKHGVSLDSTSRSNVVHLNIFTDNGEDSQGYDGGSGNEFDDGGEGNYWSDYDGEDDDGDGIGDTPYQLDPSSKKDRYPLMTSDDITPPENREWVVDDDNGAWADFNTIQDAINASIDGDRIYVYGGTYSWRIHVNRSVSLIGNGTSDTTHISRDLNHFKIGSDNVLIQGFNITDSRQFHENAGVSIYQRSNITIKDCLFYNDHHHGISISQSNNITIFNSSFKKCSNGTWVTSSENIIIEDSFYHDNYDYGIALHGSSEVQIIRTELNFNEWGLVISNCENITLGGSIISSNENGILFTEGTTDCVITNNSIIDNHEGLSESYGIMIRDDGSPSNNLIYMNNISGNDINALDNGENNRWDNGSIGNLWSDYNGSDRNRDGIGDDPYPINGSAGASDRYPMMENPIIGLQTWIVDDDEGRWADFNRIQDAFNASIDGDEVIIYGGEYLENTVLNASIHVQGNGTSTIINGSGADPCIILNSGNTTIEGLYLVNGTYGMKIRASNVSIDDCIITSCETFGIDITSSPDYYDIWNVTVRGVEVSSTLYGIRSKSFGSKFKDISLEACQYGLLIAGEYNVIRNVRAGNSTHRSYPYSGSGIWLNSTDNNTIDDCYFYNCNVGIVLGTIASSNSISNIVAKRCERGIILYEDCDYNTIRDSRFIDCEIGIEIKVSNYNQIMNCKFINMTDHGIYLRNSCRFNLVRDCNLTDSGQYSIWNGWYGQYNRFYLNQLNWARDDGADNLWDNGSHGNLWMHYDGNDSDGDGIGDTPYAINGSAEAEDRYPVTSLLYTGFRRWFVDDDLGWWADFDNIQDAINASDDGDVIRVFSGEYRGRIIINRSIRIIGNSSDDTTIDGLGIRSSVLVSSENATFSNFRVINSSDEKWYYGLIRYNHAGIRIEAENCLIEFVNATGHYNAIKVRDEYCIIRNTTCSNNTFGLRIRWTSRGIFRNCTAYNNTIGFWINESTNSEIFDCTGYDNDIGLFFGGFGSNENNASGSIFYDNDVGIRLYNYYGNSDNQITDCDVYNNSIGIDIGNGKYNNVSLCRIHNNSNEGIKLTSSYRKWGGSIIGNEISYNGYGIRLERVYHANITFNDISYNDKEGVYIEERSDNNTVKLNNFSKNNDGAVQAHDDGTSNAWDNGSIGNYWSDYKGVDADEDGIGDTPYQISGQANASDGYPIYRNQTGSTGENLKPTARIRSISRNSTYAGETVHFNGSGDDPDGFIEAYFWFSSRDGLFYNGSSNSTVNSSLSVGLHYIYFKVMDNEQSWSEVVFLSLAINKRASNNTPPSGNITSISSNVVKVNGSITLSAGGNDTDGEIFRYVWISSIDSLVYNGTNATVTLTNLSAGTHDLQLYVLDDDGAWSEASNTTVLINIPPEAVVSDGFDGSEVNGTVTLTGTAGDDDGSIAWVEISIDGGSWKKVNGTSSWSYEWDTRGYDDGNHTIRVRSFDGYHLSTPDSFTIEVDNSDPAGERGGKKVDPGFFIVLGIAISLSIILLAVFIHLRLNRPRP